MPLRPAAQSPVHRQSCGALLSATRWPGQHGPHGGRDLGFLFTHPSHIAMKLNRLTTMVILAMVLGTGRYACHAWAPTPEAAKEIAGYFGLLTDIFLRMIK